MSVQSGFFEAEWDPELFNEETQTLGDWDRKYLAEQFARYFSKFVSTGVMNDTPNQLRVIAGSGMNVVVSIGFALINGYWCYNDELLSLNVPLNETPSTRYDSVRLRWNATTRHIEIIYIADDIVNVRNDMYYDLQIAQIKVDPSTSAISDDDITDTRSNTELCGLIDIVKASDISVLQEAITKIINGTTIVARASNATNATNASNVTNDFILKDHETFTFTNNICTITDERITANSLADVYFDSTTFATAERASISVETYDGYVQLTAGRTPSGTISGSIKIRVV